MIVYSATKSAFNEDVLRNSIESKILSQFERNLGFSTSRKEIDSWRNSMMYMRNILDDPEIPENVSISIEYRIPQTSKRIDFIISGAGERGNEVAIIIELKQWSEIKKTDKDAVVSTFVGGGVRETGHPSYQAWTYAALLRDFNSIVQDDQIDLKPCAYLHNLEDGTAIHDDFYKEHLEKAPAFIRADAEKLTQFIKSHVKHGDKKGTMYRIDNGKIRPSKNLADELHSLMKGNQEFYLIDDQKVVFETALKLAKESTAKNKNVLIVEGGPGSGKTVVAINLLVKFTGMQFTSKYVTKNAAPREVYFQKLTGSFTKSYLSNLFVGSGGFHVLEANTFDTLIVDEAHRLNAKSGMFQNKGENQIKEIISGSKLSVFFIDENQKVTFRDIGTKDEIKKWASKLGAHVQELELPSQFRCNGSDGYLSWIDHVLQIKNTANDDLSELGYDFKVFDCPAELKSEILTRNEINNKSRIVAGYCWDWKTKGQPALYDIEIGKFRARWNLQEHGGQWIIHPESAHEVGCIHTCQGLELDYVGVIIGPDLVVRSGLIKTDGTKRSRMDQSLKGFKGMLKKEPEVAKSMADEIIRNTYRTLMTRGAKGCYIHCTDPETNEYFKRNSRERSQS